MQPIQTAQYRINGEPDHLCTSRTMQADMFELFFAASQTEDFGPVWISECLSDRGRVGS